VGLLWERSGCEEASCERGETETKNAWQGVVCVCVWQTGSLPLKKLKPKCPGLREGRN
jgi:hypothetical protein